MKLASIHFYPVKSMSGHDLGEAEVQPWGLAGDRRYLVTDEHGTIITARDHPRLLACLPEQEGGTGGTGGTLVLTGPHAAPLRVTPTTSRRPVVMGGVSVDLTDCGDDASRWLAGLIGRPARLAWLDDPGRRPVDPLYGRPDDRVNLADAFPLLLATAESLARLDEWVAMTAAELGEEPPAPLPMRRFRPNVVVSGAEAAFAEDGWTRVRIGEVGFRVTKGCDRCVLTTIDPVTYTKGKEPIRTLSKHRKWDGKVWFGINLIPDSPGKITLADEVTAS